MSVVVGCVKMADSKVKGGTAHFLDIVEAVLIAEVLPQSQRNHGKLKPAFSAAAVYHSVITIFFRCIHNNIPFRNRISLVYHIITEKSTENVVIRKMLTTGAYNSKIEGQ